MREGLAQALGAHPEAFLMLPADVGEPVPAKGFRRPEEFLGLSFHYTSWEPDISQDIGNDGFHYHLTNIYQASTLERQDPEEHTGGHIEADFLGSNPSSATNECVV